MLQVHPVCGTCEKNGSECVYDVSAQGDVEAPNSRRDEVHGVKRRREISRPLEEDVEDLQSIYGHLRQAGSVEQKSGSTAIEARLDKLTSMVERLSKNQPLDSLERQLLAQNVNPSLKAVEQH